MNFADTNWLVAMFFEHGDELKHRNETVARFLRMHGGQMLVSDVVMLEAENVFRATAKESNPRELDDLKNDSRFYRDPMNWTYLKRDAVELFHRYSHKARLGSFDVTLLASAKLSGATMILSFDEVFKALAKADGLEVFPKLNQDGLDMLKQLRF